jgi:hypothetical protein
MLSWSMKPGPRAAPRWWTALTQPLTPARARQIRVQLALMPLYGWAVFVWTIYAMDVSTPGRIDRSGHVKGHDFVHFYVLGQMGAERATAELYSFGAHAARADRVVAGHEPRFLPAHTPQVALFFAPFGAQPYERALAIWLAISAAVYAASCWILWKALPELGAWGWIVALGCVGFPAFHALLAAGQTSSLALAWFTIGYFALKADRPWLAGFALGVLVYKPTLGLAAACVFFSARYARVIAGAVAAAALQFALAWIYFGWAAIAGYIDNFRQVASSLPLLEAQPHLMHSLSSFFSMFLPWPRVAVAAYAISAVVILAIAVRTWRTSAPLELRYSVLLLATVLVNPHVYSYELVVIVPAFLLLAAWAVRNPAAGRTLWTPLAMVFITPALDAFTSVSRVQWSVIAMTALTVTVAKRARSAREPAS